MTIAIRKLGQIVKEYREKQNLTQKQLANIVYPPTNRTVIAHLEQGLRLPSFNLLSKICHALEIPLELWEPFLSKGFQRVRTESSQKRILLRPFNFIALSGISGSGKTTLARAISYAFNLPVLPDKTLPKSYLKDLSINPKRWAFETQLAFLINKSIEMIMLLESDKPAIVDRTLSEDVNIYAKYFQSRGDIEKRASDTYAMIAKYFFQIIPQPDIVIYSKCSLEKAKQRIDERNRFDKEHHLKMIENIFDLYESWINSYEGTSVYEINSEINDYRDPVIIQGICHDLEFILDSEKIYGNKVQLNLFTADKEQNLRFLKPLNISIDCPGNSTRSPIELTPRYSPCAYIAAPFTGEAKNESKDDLFNTLPVHGKIPKGGYREVLFGIERVLNDLGIIAILPHRDVNQWGNKTITPGEAMVSCTEHVRDCDLFVGLLGESSGAHYEFGLALGCNKPCIIILCQSLSNSFLAKGSNNLISDKLMVVQCNDTKEIASALKEQNVRNFILRNLKFN